MCIASRDVPHCHKGVLQRILQLAGTCADLCEWQGRAQIIVDGRDVRRSLWMAGTCADHCGYRDVRRSLWMQGRAQSIGGERAYMRIADSSSVTMTRMVT
jgi:hypothetical protein